MARVSTAMVMLCPAPWSQKMVTHNGTRSVHDPMTVLNALTIDVEDYFHVTAFEKQIDRTSWDRYDSRVVPNTRRLLEMFEEHDVKATFFILGWVADRFPELVHEIHEAGHEIGSHSYWHRLVYEVSPEEFRDDLRRSRDVLEDLTGQAITVFRAPSFSVTRRSLWALEILAEEGFRIDSSIYPIIHDRYGIPDAEQHIHAVDTAAGRLWEFPGSVARFGRFNLPVSGGGYFRLYPLRWTHFCLQRINQSESRPFMFYIHPWEHDHDQPRLNAGSRVSRFRHYVNLSSMESKLDWLLRRFRFGRLSEVVGQHQIDSQGVDGGLATLRHNSKAHTQQGEPFANGNVCDDSTVAATRPFPEESQARRG